MAIIEFENLPSTSTPLSAENLNNNFGELETNINNLETDFEDLYNEIQACKTVTFNNEWRTAFKPSGSNLVLELPIFNPTGSAPTVNISSAELYNGSWKTISGVVVAAHNTNQVILRLNNNENLTNGNVYLVRLVGTVVAN